MYKTQAIVLKKFPFRSQDRRFIVYTKKRGKVKAVCRGGQKITSKMAPHLEPLNIVNVMIAPGARWNHIAGVEASHTFRFLRQTITGLRLGVTFLQLTDIFTREEDSEEHIFPLVLGYLRWLDEAVRTQSLQTRKQLEDVIHGFVWQLFSIIGIALQLDRCQEEEAHDLQFPAFFDPAHGGFVCAHDRNLSRNGQRLALDQSDFQQLKTLQNHSVNPSTIWPLTPSVKQIISTWYFWQSEQNIHFVPFGLTVLKNNFSTFATPRS